MTQYRDLEKKWKDDPKYIAEYDKLDAEFSLTREMIKARISSGLTQEQIAEKMGTTQSAVARLLDPANSPSIRTLQKFADAVGKKLTITFK